MGHQAREKGRQAYKKELRHLYKDFASGLAHDEEAARNYVKAGKLNKAIGLYEKYGARYAELARDNAENGQDDLAKYHYEVAAKSFRSAGRLKRALSGKFRPMSKANNLEHTALAATTLGVLGALFFLSPTITGDAIGNLNQTSSNWIGGVLFLIGLVGAFVYFRKR